MPEKTTEPKEKTIPSFKEVHLSVGAVLTAYNMLQPLEDHDPKEPRYRLAPPGKDSLLTVVELLDVFETCLDKILEANQPEGQEEKLTTAWFGAMSLKELKAMSEQTLTFSVSQFQIIKEYFHDDKKKWPGDHYTLKITAECIRVFT